MKKIFFLIWALEVGGAERLLVKLVQNIPRDKYDVTVVCLSREGVWAREVMDSGIRGICLNKKTGFDLLILPRLIGLFRRERPDIVNTYLWTADLWGRLAAVIAGVKHIIVTEQNVDLWKKWYHVIIDKILFRWTEKVICVSHEVVKFYHDSFDVPKHKLVMIPNAIDVMLFDRECAPTGLRAVLGIGENEFVFVCAARLHPQKRHEVLIDAVNKMRERGTSSFRLLLVGEGERRQELDSLVQREGLQEVVHFLGLRQDIPDILLQVNGFVLSSDYEGLSLAILEAMAARLPVVATSVGGNPQIIQDGINGYLVPPRDSSALADAMGRLVEDRNRARLMGCRGRKQVEEIYEIKAVTRQTLDLFKECVR